MLRACKPVVDVEYHPESDRSPTEAVIEAVATVDGVDTTEPTVMYDAVDPDAIENLLRHDEPGAAETFLRFRVDSWNVFLRSDGRIRVCDRSAPTEPEPVFAGQPTGSSTRRTT